VSQKQKQKSKQPSTGEGWQEANVFLEIDSSSNEEVETSNEQKPQKQKHAHANAGKGVESEEQVPEEKSESDSADSSEESERIEFSAYGRFDQFGTEEGPKAKCISCQKVINMGRKRVVHVYFHHEVEGELRYEYHLQESCLQGLSPYEMAKFVEIEERRCQQKKSQLLEFQDTIQQQIHKARYGTP